MKETMHLSRCMRNLHLQRFKKLIVLDAVGYNKNKDGTGFIIWKCLCDCGNQKVASSDDLIEGRTGSCGCLRRESQNSSVKVGKQYKYLTVIQRSRMSPASRSIWLCQCICGNYIEVIHDSLSQGKKSSCGCRRDENRSKIKKGDRFGRLVAIERTSPHPDRKGHIVRWICLCDCGNKKSVYSSELLMSHTRSCGCIKRTCGEGSVKYKGHHGISGSYWGVVKKGASVRGLSFSITIEYAWQLFLDQGETCALTGLPLKIFSSRRRGIYKTASLDRINSELGYEVGNVQWVHKDVNQLKMDLDEDRLFFLCNLVAGKHNAINHPGKELLDK